MLVVPPTTLLMVTAVPALENEVAFVKVPAKEIPPVLKVNALPVLLLESSVTLPVPVIPPVIVSLPKALFVMTRLLPRVMAP